MSIDIAFPKPISVPREVPLYEVVPPAWSREKVARLAEAFDLKGEITDAGAWYVARNGSWALEVYQASHSLRLERLDFDAEGRDGAVKALDRQMVTAEAESFLKRAGPASGEPALDSVTELRVAQAVRGRGAPEARVVGLQANFRYAIDGLALVGPGAKAQVTVGHDGRIAQAYRFSRALKWAGALATTPLERAFERFAASEQFRDLGRGARVQVNSVDLGLLSLPPTEVQGVLRPSYVLRGEVSTELQPRYEFVSYVAAAELDEADAKKQRWAQARPALLMS